MIGEAITLILSNIPLLMFLAALVAASLHRSEPNVPLRYLSWLLLLSEGVTGIWAGIFHIFFPDIASASIGWQPSPFEYEIGVADIAAGVAAVVSFWRGIEFKAAVVWYLVIFNIGVAIEHLRQAFGEGDYSANNFGVLLALTVIQAALLPWLLHKARHHDAGRLR